MFLRNIIAFGDCEGREKSFGKKSPLGEFLHCREGACSFRKNMRCFDSAYAPLNMTNVSQRCHSIPLKLPQNYPTRDRPQWGNFYPLHNLNREEKLSRLDKLSRCCMRYCESESLFKAKAYINKEKHPEGCFSTL